jgi:hypothetical protein
MNWFSARWTVDQLQDRDRVWGPSSVLLPVSLSRVRSLKHIRNVGHAKFLGHPWPYGSANSHRQSELEVHSGAQPASPSGCSGATCRRQLGLPCSSRLWQGSRWISANLDELATDDRFQWPPELTNNSHEVLRAELEAAFLVYIAPLCYLFPSFLSHTCSSNPRCIAGPVGYDENLKIVCPLRYTIPTVFTHRLWLFRLPSPHWICSCVFPTVLLSEVGISEEGMDRFADHRWSV